MGSATALTSATERPAQPVSGWNDGLGSTVEQPDPVAPQAGWPEGEVTTAFQTFSDQPRPVPGSRVSEVPPTEVTSGEEAG